jgi:hypothetical protein
MLSPLSLPVTQSVLYDDNFKGSMGRSISLSASDLAKAIDISDTHLKLVFYNACLMNMLENLGELIGHADYAYAASHVTWTPIFDYAELMNLLKSGRDFEILMDEYVTYAMKRWKEEDGRAIDIMVTDLNKLTPSFAVIKELVDTLKDDAQFAALTDLPIKKTEAQTGVYFYDNRKGATAELLSFVDIIQFLEYIDTQIDTDLKPKIEELFDAFDKAELTFDQHNVPIETSYSVNIINNFRLEADFYNDWTAEDGYRALNFNKQTGWYDLFTVMDAEPVEQ